MSSPSSIHGTSGQPEDAADAGTVSGYHVALDLALARRAADDAEAILINGFILPDCGGYELCVARLSLSIFWQMKAMDTYAASRLADAPCDETGMPPGGCVWQIEGRLAAPERGSVDAWNRDGGPPRGTRPEVQSDGDDRIFPLEIKAVVALDRVWLGRSGPRLHESFEAAAFLPEQHC